MNKLSTVVVGALAGAAFMAPAGAAIVVSGTQTISFGGVTDFTSPKTFMLFDSNLGTLKAITVSDRYGITSTVMIQNNAASASSGFVSTESTFTLSANDAGQNAVLTALLNPLQAQTSKISYALDASESTTGSDNTPSPVFNAPVSTTTASDLAEFAVAGGGTAQVVGKTSTTTTQTNTGGNTTTNQVTTGSGAFQIYYTYDDSTAVVPEPATWGMMILGFGMIGAMARRRRPKVSFAR